MTSSDYISLLCETLLNFQRDGTLCDVVIKARNGAVHAHSSVLAASNEHLRRTLEDQSNATSNNKGGRFVYRFDLNNCSLAAIISVLHSLYSGKEFSTVDPECLKTMLMMGFPCPQETAELKTMVTNSSYKLSQSLLGLQHDGILCDVTINAGNGSVHAHSAILAAANPILRSLFEMQAAEASIESRRLQYVVDLHDFSLDSIVTSLQSVYVGKVVGLCTMEEKDRYLRLTALGLGITNAHVADTTSCQSSADTRVQTSTTTRGHSIVLRKLHRVELGMESSKLNQIDSTAPSQPLLIKGLKKSIIKSYTSNTSQEVAQVTSSDDVNVEGALSKLQVEVYGVMEYKNIRDFDAPEYKDVEELEHSKDVLEEVESGISVTNDSWSKVDTSSYLVDESSELGLQDCISSTELYIECATEETVEMEQEEEETQVSVASPAAHKSRSKPESILIIPAAASQKRRFSGVEQFASPKFPSSTQMVRPTGSRNVRPATVTVIDFQKVKAAEGLNRQLRVDRNIVIDAAERKVIPPKRYYLASKTNHAIALQLSQQPKPSSSTNQVSILLPQVGHQRSLREEDFNKVSILKMAADTNEPTANKCLKRVAYNQRQNGGIDVNNSTHLGGKFGRIGNINTTVTNFNTENRSLLLPIGNCSRNADLRCEPSSDVSVSKHTINDGSAAIFRMSPKNRRGISNQSEKAYTRTKEVLLPECNSEPHHEEVEMYRRRKEDNTGDREGANESERESNNDSDNRRSVRKRKTTVPVKNVQATSTCRGDGEVEESSAGANSVTNDPPCEEVEVTTSTDMKQVRNSIRYAPIEEMHGAHKEETHVVESIEMSSFVEDYEEQNGSEEKATIEEIHFEESSTSLPNNGDNFEFFVKAEGIHENLSCPEIFVKDEYSTQGSSNVQNSEDMCNMEGVLYTVSEAIHQVENSVGFGYDGSQEAAQDEQMVEAVVEEVDAEGNVTTMCKYCEKVFECAAELSEHITSQHRCSECSHEFKQTSNLRKHVRIHHNDERTHECPVCRKGFAFRSALKDHIRIHEDFPDDQPTYACDKCSKVFSRISGLRRHSKVDHSDVLAYKCTQCDKRYAYRCNLNNHMTTHSELKPFTCESCGLGFKQNSNLLKHMRTQHNKCLRCVDDGQCTCGVRPGYVCSTCGKACSGRAQLRVHKRVHSGEKPEVCDLCGTAFQHKSNLVKHRIKHGGTKPYICSYCLRGFYSNHSLQSHMRLHTGESPHQCDVCGKRFCTRNGLQVHSVLHGDQRQFECGTCGKAFAQLGNLNKHIAIHTGARPFPCNQCSMAFVDSSALRRHKVLHTRERNFACTTCGRTFMYLTSLRAHKLTHEEGKQYLCKICGKAFRQKAGYMRHLKIHEDNTDCAGEEVVLKPGEYIVYLTE